MESNILERLKEAAAVAEDDPCLTIQIVEYGVLVKYTWEQKLNRNYTLGHLISWKEVDKSWNNVIIMAFTSLKKEAGAMQ